MLGNEQLSTFTTSSRNMTTAAPSVTAIYSSDKFSRRCVKTFFFYTFHPEARIYKPNHVMTDSAHDYRRVAHALRVSAGPEHG